MPQNHKVLANPDIGSEWGMLTVIGYATVRGRPAIVCECVCGAERTVMRSQVLSGHSRSCGRCIRVKDPLIVRANRAWHRHRNGARVGRGHGHARGVEFALSKADVLACLSSGPCVWCGDPEPSSLDRIDNGIGYVVGNVMPSCARCNVMRGGLSVEEFETAVLAVAGRISSPARGTM